MKLFYLILLFLFLCLSSSKGQVLHNTLPKQVPYCGPLEDYFAGSGVSGAMGTPNGIWNALIGPNYTSPNFLKSEILSVKIDGKTTTINPQMHRARKTGIFYGIMDIYGVVITLVDFTNDKKPWVTRFVSVKNNSGNTRKISINAKIVPTDIISDVMYNSAISLHADTTIWNFDQVNLESKNWADRYSLITFNVPCTASKTYDSCKIITKEILLRHGNEFCVSLYHFQHFKEAALQDADFIRNIKKRNSRDDLAQSITDWNSWFDEGTMFEDKIKDEKAKDVIEGSLVMVKMLQDSSGGFIAGLREYPHSYVRDTHGACRLLTITGHTKEVKKAIETISYKTGIFGHIPNAWQMGADVFHYYKFNNPASETPAYYVLMIKNYLEKTKDQKFVDSKYSFLKNAIDVQLNEMKSNNWRIDFNGDETERYTVNKDGDMYGKLSDWAEDKDLKNWSFPSAVLALTSTNFFIGYLSSTGRQELAKEYTSMVTQIKNSIDSTFWRSDLNIHDWCRRLDNSWPVYRLPNYNLLPVWLDAELNYDRQIQDALAMKQFLNPINGFLPTAPGDVNGFSGHNLAYMLYDLKKLNDPLANEIFKTLMTAPIIYCWGTVSEFYGPNAVPNGHLLNPFSSGILGEALIRYSIGF